MGYNEGNMGLSESCYSFKNVILHTVDEIIIQIRHLFCISNGETDYSALINYGPDT